jgi:hypothetical protein
MRTVMVAAVIASATLALGCQSSDDTADKCAAIRHAIVTDKQQVIDAMQAGDEMSAARARVDVDADARAARDPAAVGGVCDIDDLVGPGVGR